MKIHASINRMVNKELTKGQKAVENLEDVMAFGIHMILEIDVRYQKKAIRDI